MISQKTIILLDSWQIKAYETCPEAFNLAYNENLRKIYLRASDKMYPQKGTMVHSMLAIYYTLKALYPQRSNLKHGTATINLVKNNKLIRNAGFDAAFEDFLITRFKQYLFTYSKDDFRPRYKNGVTGVEVPFAVKLFEDSRVCFILEGRIDLIGHYSNLESLAFIDHKSQWRASNYYAKKTQFRCYALGSGLEYGIVNYFGMQQDLKPESSLRRQVFRISKQESEDYKNYLITQVYNKIYHAMYERRWNSCSGAHEKYPCEFTEVCEAYRKPEVQALLKKQNYEVVSPWTPWEYEELAEISE